MQELQLQGRREALRLAAPVAEQRGRHDQQRGSAVRTAQAQQQRQHLQGLAQAHVVGQARTQAEPAQKVQPAHAVALVGPQRRAQRVAGVDGVHPGGIAQLGQCAAQRRAGFDEAPVAVGGIAVVPQVGRRAGEQAHPLDEADLPGARLPLHAAPMLQGSLQPFGIHFHPAALEQHQALAAGQQGLDLVRAERVVAERHVQIEVQHRVQAEAGALALVHGELHARPRAGLPPVRDAHRQAAVLERRYALQEPMRVGRFPGARRPVDLAAVHERAQPGQALGRLLQGLQQAQQRGAVACAGVLLQRVAERHVPQASGVAQAGRIGRHECERPLGIGLVLRQVQADAAHLTPLRRAPGDEALQTAVVSQRLLRVRVQRLPERQQRVRGQVLAAGKRRCGAQPGVELRRRRWRHRGLGCIRRDMAQRGQILLGDALPIAQPGPCRRLRPPRREQQQALAPVRCERANDLAVRQVGVGRVGSDPAQLRRRRELELGHGRQSSPPASGASKSGHPLRRDVAADRQAPDAARVAASPATRGGRPARRSTGRPCLPSRAAR
jgi:hypothetical protein